MERDLQKRIDEALDVKNYIEPVSPRPFFYTRVMAKMEKTSSPLISMVPVPIRIACSLVLLLNIVFFSLSSKQNKTSASEQLASFYEINSSSVY
jgi:hypothetical protein